MNDNDRSIVALVMVAHGMVHTYELSIPIFIPIWLDAFDVVSLGPVDVAVTTATLGLLVTLGYGLFGVGALPGGLLADRVGSRRLIAACLVGMAASFLLLGVAPGLVAVTLAMVTWGASASVYHPAGLSLLSKGVTERGTGFAYHGIAGNLGIGLGPLLTAVLLLFTGWRTVAAVLAVPALLAAAYAARADFDETAAVPDETSAATATEVDGGGAADAGDGVDGIENPADRVEKATDDEEEATEDGEHSTAGRGSRAGTSVDSVAAFRREAVRLFGGGFGLVFLMVMCSGLYYRGVLTFMPGLLAGLPGFEPVPLATLLPAPVRTALGVDPTGGLTLAPARYFYAGLLMVGVLGQYAGGKLTDRVRVERGLVAGFGLLALLAVLFLPVAALGVGPLLALGAVLGASLFVVQPFYQATVAEYTPPDTRGLAYGFTYLGVFGVGALGGAIAGAVLAYANPATLFATLAGFATVAALTAVTLARR